MNKFVLLFLFGLLAVAFSAPTEEIVKVKKESSSSSSESKEKAGKVGDSKDGLVKKTADSSEEKGTAVKITETITASPSAPVTPLEPLPTPTSATIVAPLGGTR